MAKKLIYNIAYFGEGDYLRKDKAYDTWYSMIRRCYSQCETKKFYEGCEVCEEWLNFQNFAKWFHSIDYKQDDWNLDKDLLVYRNKLYSPKTCCFLPKIINTGLAIRSLKEDKQSLYPGVSIYSRDNTKFIVKGREYGKKVQIGIFDNLQDAINSYLERKRLYLINLGNQYKVPDFILTALSKFEY